MKVMLSSGNNELYNALRRALKYLAGIDLVKDSGRFSKRDVVIYAVENNEFDSWIWGNFRKKALSPLVVIGDEEKIYFMNRNPVFTAYTEEHAYFQIPFDLKNFIDKIHAMKPIYDDLTRKLIVNDFSKGFEHKLVTHDLKIIKGDKAASIDNLARVRDFYRSKGDSNPAKIIDDKINEIESQADWEQIALDCRSYLIERLTRKI